MEGVDMRGKGGALVGCLVGFLAFPALLLGSYGFTLYQTRIECHR